MKLQMKAWKKTYGNYSDVRGRRQRMWNSKLDTKQVILDLLYHHCQVRLLDLHLVRKSS